LKATSTNLTSLLFHRALASFTRNRPSIHIDLISEFGHGDAEVLLMHTIPQNELPPDELNHLVSIIFFLKRFQLR